MRTEADCRVGAEGPRFQLKLAMNAWGSAPAALKFPPRQTVPSSDSMHQTASGVTSPGSEAGVPGQRLAGRGVEDGDGGVRGGPDRLEHAAGDQRAVGHAERGHRRVVRELRPEELS